MNGGKYICRINTHGFALASTGVMGIVYIVCAVFVSLWPALSVRLLGWMLHLVNVEKFAGGVAITFGGFLVGLAQVLLYTYIGAWLIAWIHNKFSVKMS